jgi:hypothetical protein
MKSDVEMCSFDLGLESDSVFDSQGNVYITDKNCIIATEEGVRLKAFDVGQVTDTALDEYMEFNYDIGHRFDSKNSNWILFSEYLSMSFSFMTFVIKDKMDSVDDYLDPNNTFDPTIYNYLINRRNCFTSDNLVGENYEKLYFILSNMEKVDPTLLE